MVQRELGAANSWESHVPHGDAPLLHADKHWLVCEQAYSLDGKSEFAEYKRLKKGYRCLS